MRKLLIEPRLDGLGVVRLDEFSRTNITGGKPRQRRQFVNSNFEMSLQFVMNDYEWQYLQRFERVVGADEFEFYATYRTAWRELFRGCFTSPIQWAGRSGKTIFASVTVSALPAQGFDADNDEAFLALFEEHQNDPIDLEFYTRDIRDVS